jgi:hypothetical protein
MPAGIPGEVTRLHTYGCTIEQQKQHPTTPVTRYGDPVVIESTGTRPIAGTDTTNVVVGFLVRPFPGTDVTVAFPAGKVPFGAATPPTTGIVDVLRRGYISVNCRVGTPVKGGAVHIWYGTPSGAHVIGGIEAAATASNTFEVTNAKFTGAKDANGNVEVQFNL